jgi:hypothetical protein
MNQTIRIQTSPVGDSIGVSTYIEPGFEDNETEAHYLAKTLIAILHQILPSAVAQQYAPRVELIQGRWGYGSE